MIWYNNISKNFMVSLFQNVKPFINIIIAICFFNKRKPLMTGECYKIDSAFVNRSMQRHELKYKYLFMMPTSPMAALKHAE